MALFWGDAMHTTWISAESGSLMYHYGSCRTFEWVGTDVNPTTERFWRFSIEKLTVLIFCVQ